MCYVFVIQAPEDDPDRAKSWFELGAKEGVEIVDDDELEVELEKEEEDKEVAQIYRENKKQHEQMLRGTCIHVLIVLCVMSKESKVQCTNYDRFNAVHVKRVEILTVLAYFSYSSCGKGTSDGGRRVGLVRTNVQGDSTGATATAAALTQDVYNADSSTNSN